MSARSHKLPTFEMRNFPHAVSPVLEVEASDIGTLQKMVSEHRPFVARGIVNSWPLTELLSEAATVNEQIACFDACLADADIRFTYTAAEQRGDIGIGPDLAPNFRMDDRTMAGRDFFSIVSSLIENPTGECAYASALPMSELPQELANQPSLDTIGGSRPRQRNMWIGSGDHVVDLHFDYMRNLISMNAGVKRITIMPPAALPHIYPAPLHLKVAGVVRSLVKLLDVDFDQYPRFHHCLDLAQVVTLEPGDTLYIPPLWWHHVESYGFNVMVNAWYADIPESAQKPLVDATALFRNSLSKLSRFDDADLDALHAELYSIGRSGTRFEHRTGEKSHKSDMRMRLKAQSGRLQEIFTSIADLPPFWQDHIELLYEYYVFRRYGDPYPTLPGMLDGVAREFRPGLIGKVSRRTFALRKRLFPGQ